MLNSTEDGITSVWQLDAPSCHFAAVISSWSNPLSHKCPTHWSGGIQKWAWSEVQTEQLTVTGCVRLQLQYTKEETRGTTQTYTAKSYEWSLRGGCACMVKVSKFSSQIPLPQTTRRDEPQCRGTICNIFEVQMKAFSKVPLTFWETVCFHLKST